MNAQHTISKLSGFSKWEDIINANENEIQSSHKILDSSSYKLKLNKKISATEFKRNILPAPQNLYALIQLNAAYGISIQFSFDSVEYADSYMIYYSDEKNTSTAKPLASGNFSPINYMYRGNRTPALFFWVRAYDGKEYGEWSQVAVKNR